MRRGTGWGGGNANEGNLAGGRGRAAASGSSRLSTRSVLHLNLRGTRHSSIASTAGQRLPTQGATSTPHSLRIVCRVAACATPKPFASKAGPQFFLGELFVWSRKFTPANPALSSLQLLAPTDCPTLQLAKSACTTQMYRYQEARAATSAEAAQSLPAMAPD